LERNRSIKIGGVVKSDLRITPGALAALERFLSCGSYSRLKSPWKIGDVDAADSHDGDPGKVKEGLLD
jgi:hypothetical protein